MIVSVVASRFSEETTEKMSSWRDLDHNHKIASSVELELEMDRRELKKSEVKLYRLSDLTGVLVQKENGRESFKVGPYDHF